MRVGLTGGKLTAMQVTEQQERSCFESVFAQMSAPGKGEVQRVGRLCAASSTSGGTSGDWLCDAQLDCSFCSAFKLPPDTHRGIIYCGA